eukprot:CAMPEP_0201517346 /NCGR_PEP_ID=MMETSP0161_2-20130828/8474_1 /ASSEMBLY_ACC=CAM_ASM_000251 /TAXON_ID=180227 /ORGANISM="Neoparamoeba aestuarina, Strain SoJaBio B1-5/56/2" /LENGTH=447 /DNA_ID=CAMNT_0047914813 /DNA_START=173 /DNA_END=1512 /DNA_ORIENTATION=+
MRISSMTSLHPRFLWLGFQNGQIATVDFLTNTHKLTYCDKENEHVQRVNALEADRGRKKVWSGSEDGCLKVWENMLVGVCDEMTVDLTSRRAWLEVKRKDFAVFWDMMWVVLSDGFLRLYKDQYFGPEEHSLSVTKVIEVKGNENGKGMRVVELHTGNETWRLGGTEGEIRKWEEVINRILASRDGALQNLYPLCSYPTGHKVTCLVVVDEVVWAVEAGTLHEYTLAMDPVERERGVVHRGYKNVIKPLRLISLDLSGILDRHRMVQSVVKVSASVIWVAVGIHLFIVDTEKHSSSSSSSRYYSSRSSFSRSSSSQSPSVEQVRLIKDVFPDGILAMSLVGNEVWIAGGSNKIVRRIVGNGEKEIGVVTLSSKSKNNEEMVVRSLLPTPGCVWAANDQSKLLKVCDNKGRKGGVQVVEMDKVHYQLWNARDSPTSLVEGNEGAVWVG